MGHFVYKYVLDNEVIYIGKNDTNLHSRLAQHGKAGDNIPAEAWDDINKADIFYCTLANSTMSDVVESELIRRYKPKYNTAKRSEWSGLDFVEPKWKKYVPPKNVPSKKRKYEQRLIDCYTHNLSALNAMETVLNKISSGNYEIHYEEGQMEYWIETNKQDSVCIRYISTKGFGGYTVIGKMYDLEDDKMYCCVTDFVIAETFDYILSTLKQKEEIHSKMIDDLGLHIDNDIRNKFKQKLGIVQAKWNGVCK